MGGLTIPIMLEPVAGLALLTLLALLLRWTYSRGRSHVASPARAGSGDDYGLLVEVVTAESADEAREIRSRLAAASIRSTAADGGRVMVFSEDAERAKAYC